MFEQEIKDVITDALAGEIYPVKDHPLSEIDYAPSHPKGELLIKSLGTRPIKYLNDGRLSMLDTGIFPIYEYQWRVDIVSKVIRTQEELFALTKNVIDKLSGKTVPNIEAGVLRLVSVGEPFFDDNAKFLYRVLVFSILVTHEY